MMPAAVDPAARLRAARLLFERAMHDGVSMEEARSRIQRERWEAATARLERKRASTGLCGTAAPALPTSDTTRPTQWWQRD